MSVIPWRSDNAEQTGGSSGWFTCALFICDADEHDLNQVNTDLRVKN